MRENFYELIEANPVIAAVKDDKGLETLQACEDIRVVFTLYGDVCNIGRIVEKIKEAGKIAIVHMDLVEGLSGKESTVDFIHQHTKADGIISTKPALIKRGKELGLYTILRIFILDSMAFENIRKQMSVAKPDALEILPGLMPKIIKRVCKMARVPVIAGGLVETKEQVISLLSAGAHGISTSREALWTL